MMSKGKNIYSGWAKGISRAEPVKMAAKTIPPRYMRPRANTAKVHQPIPTRQTSNLRNIFRRPSLPLAIAVRITPARLALKAAMRKNISGSTPAEMPAIMPAPKISATINIEIAGYFFINVFIFFSFFIFQLIFGIPMPFPI
jgi:hypothetical protein